MADLNWLKKVRVQVPKRSGFDKSHRNLFTLPCGTLVPMMCDEVIPNTRVHLKLALNASLPPLATDAFMNVKLKTEAFFVPSRLLYGGYEQWLTGQSVNLANVSIPIIRLDETETEYIKAGTLLDYLGFRQNGTISPASGSRLSLNAFPVLAYGRIYDDWYRNTRVQSSLFERPAAGYTMGAKYLPYAIVNNPFYLDSTSTYADGTKILSLRQRNFGSDYFTECTPALSAHQGTSSQKVSTTGNEFTITALRAANSIQQWLERQSLTGLRLQDYVRSQFGASLSDGVAQRSLFLGSCDFDVYTKGVEQTTPVATTTPSAQPFKTVGTRYGSSYATGDGTLIEDFTANEPGYIFVMASLVPKVTYASGINRMLLRYTDTNSQTDLATPILQNVGPQPIYMKELNPRLAWTDSTPNAVMGYIDRNADFMTLEDELHGILRDGESLASFALQRTFNGTSILINSSFLQIPTTYLDQVCAASFAVSTYGAWVDSYFDYKIAQPLAQFCQPSLQDPAYEHGESVVIRRSGSRI